MADRLYLDLENTEDRVLMVGWALDDEAPKVTRSWCPVPEDLARALQDDTLTKVSHSKHDGRTLLRHGFPFAGPLEDTMVMAWVLDENQELDLDSLTKKYLGPEFYKDKSITQRDHRPYFKRLYALDEYDQWPSAIKMAFREYCGHDVVALRELHRALAARMARTDWLDYWAEEEVPFTRVLLDMEQRGLPINLEDTAVLAEEVRAIRDRAAHHLRLVAGLPEQFNLNSPVQVSQYLFTKGWFRVNGRIPMADPVPAAFETVKEGRVWRHGGWVVQGRGLAPTPPPKRKDKEDDEGGLPSTSSKELLYKHPKDAWVNELCLVYRRNDKLLGTYLDKFPRIARDGRIYGNYNQTGTVTGRLSSSNPNMQNIPARREVGKRVRALFQGNLVIGDYDSLEMRIMAHLSKDRRLIDVFRSGGDPHAVTAEAVFGHAPKDHDDPERDQGKLLNYSIGYGAGDKTVAMSLTLAGYPTTKAEAKEYMLLLRQAYPQLFRWKDNVIWNAKQTGGVNTLGGRRRRLAGDRDSTASWKQLMYSERQAVNAQVQGTAADILRRVMLAVSTDPAFEFLALLAQIHDELLWEYPDFEVPTAETLAYLKHVCENSHGFDLTVPLVFDPLICRTWADKGTGVQLEEDL